jgi:hypothetical protein
MTLEERLEKEREIKRHKRNARYTLFIGIALVFVIPYLITNLPFIHCKDTATTGQIGDTVGGLTSPIVNLISAILIYLSFQQQLLANEIQISMLDHEKSKDLIQVQKDSLLFHYNEIKDSIINVKYSSKWHKTHGGFDFSGTDAIETFVKDFKHNDYLNQSTTYFMIDLILIDIDTFVDAVNASNFLDDSEKEYYSFRMQNLFFQRLIIPLDGIQKIEDRLDKKNISNHLETIRRKLNLPDENKEA